MRFKNVTNAQTGEVKIIQFTAEEEVAEDARQVLVEAEIEKAGALKRLDDIDRASVRALREYIAGLPDAPQVLKEREAEAVAERALLKK